jgi:carboxymethylenebutenolidase
MKDDEITRRDFVSMTVGAGIVAATSAQQRVVETNVEIKTPDGTCDAAFIHPAAGAHPGVLIWPDAFGLRPAMREMAKRLAGDGYSVLVPNPFYRVAKSPVFENASNFNFGDPGQRGKLTPLMGSINAPGAAERDAAAFIAWLDAQAQVDRMKKIGTQGYCMGGPLVVKTADVLRYRRKRRHAATGREDQAEGSIRRCQGARRNRGVLAGATRLVCVRHAEASERRADL